MNLDWGLSMQFLLFQLRTNSSRFAIVFEEHLNSHMIEVWEDKETHQEIVCVYNKMASPSCFLSGRSFPLTETPTQR